MSRKTDAEYSRDYFKRYPERRILSTLKLKSKHLGLPFDLTHEDIRPPDVCPILGMPLMRGIGHGKSKPNSPSVDRIRPELGYVKGNIQVISKRANLMKNDANPEELKRFANWVYQTFGEN